MRVEHHFVDVDGIRLFYREAGSPEKPTLLLLHGFPASSFQFREFMPLLADEYHLVAPDLPGFGFTEVPQSIGYSYTFASLAKTMTTFTEKLSLERYAMYVFDYGAPTGFRMALAHPEKVLAIVSQNGNVYDEGLGTTWAAARRYWSEPTDKNREALRGALTPESVKDKYTHGAFSPESVAPESYTLEAALLQRHGNTDIQLDFFKDYADNVRLYPDFQGYLRRQQPPLLAIWGKNDPIFVPAGAEAFKRDLPSAAVLLINAGHFALETNVEEVASAVRFFLGSNLRA